MHAMVADSARGQGRGWKPRFGHWTVPPTPMSHSSAGSLHAAGSAATSDPTDVDPLGLLACFSACSRWLAGWLAGGGWLVAASDTDFIAKLIDVWPNGTAMLVEQGALRMRWRNGPFATHPAPHMRKGERYQIDVRPAAAAAAGAAAAPPPPQPSTYRLYLS
eukprot:COSAG06_NODE_2208_length_7340_cov_3.553515_8_plen_162_part_00